MKYQVQIKFTNPSHEHVSLRRRVDTITRIVEASSEDEAINRGANQQRALGFKIQEALILKPLNEGFDPEPSDIAAQLVKKHGKGKVTKDHVDAYERDRDSNKAIDKEAVMKHVQKMSEEVEQLSERSYLQYSGVIHSNVGNAKHGEEKDEGHHYTLTVPSHRDVGDHLSGKRAYSRVARENPHLEPHHVKAILQSTGNDKEDVEVEHGGKTYKHRLYNNQDPDYIGEEVESVDEAQKKLKPSYWKAEWRLGTQSEVDKNNKKIYDRLAKNDPVKASAFHDNLMRMKKKDVKEEVESVDEGVATAQKVMDRANVVAKTNPDPKKRFAAGGLANKAMMRTINPTGVNTGITRGGGNKSYRKITGKAPPHQLTKKTGVSEEVVTEASKEGKDVMRGMRASLKSMDLRHGVDSDKRVSGYKMSPAVKAAQAKSDMLSKKVKRPQAGTIAAVHKSMEREMLKKEAADPGSMKVVNKKVKAAEKMINAAKGKVNKVNMKPSIELEKYKE